MRRLLAAAVMCAMVSISGCTWYDALFNVFGDSYTGGGTTSYEKKLDYDERVQSYNDMQQ